MNLALEAVLGKSRNDESVQNLFKTLGGKPEVTISGEGDRTYVEFKPHGIGFMFDDRDTLTTIFLYGEEIDGYVTYTGSLPRRLNFSWDQATVRSTLGSATNSGKGHSILEPGTLEIWDRYKFDQWALHIRYGKNGRGLSLVTLMTLDAIP